LAELAAAVLAVLLALILVVPMAQLIQVAAQAVVTHRLRQIPAELAALV
jgi:hypothetical protein